MTYNPQIIALAGLAMRKAKLVNHSIELLGRDCTDLGEEVDECWQELERTAGRLESLIAGAYTKAGGKQ